MRSLHGEPDEGRREQDLEDELPDKGDTSVVGMMPSSDSVVNCDPSPSVAAVAASSP